MCAPGWTFADITILPERLQAGGEAELAMEMWWRAAALESLQAYVAGPLRKADPSEQANLARSVAALLRPTLDAVSAHPPLQVQWSLMTFIGCARFQLVLRRMRSAMLRLATPSAVTRGICCRTNTIRYDAALPCGGFSHQILRH